MGYFYFSTLNVLVVDDSKLMLQFLKNILINMGFKTDKIKTVDRYDNGVKLVSQNYDLVICDYHLDNGHNGIDLIDILKLNGIVTSNTIFIIASAETSKTIVQRCIDARIDDFFVKPLDVSFVKSRLFRSFKRIKKRF